VLLVLASDKVWKFSQTWIWLALLLYVVALGIVHAVHLPNLRRMNALAADLAAMGPPPSGAAAGPPPGPPPQAVELDQRGRTAAAIGTLLNLFVVVIVVLMV